MWAVLDRRLRVLDAMWLFVSGRPLLDPHSRALCACVLWLVVGLGVDRIVDALRMLTRAHPPPLLGFTLWCWGCCCLCWPISTSQL